MAHIDLFWNFFKVPWIEKYATRHQADNHASENDFLSIGLLKIKSISNFSTSGASYKYMYVWKDFTAQLTYNSISYYTNYVNFPVTEAHKKGGK